MNTRAGSRAWRPSTVAGLRRAGWRSERNVLGQVKPAKSLPLLPAAEQVLAEFGNLKFGDKSEHLHLDPSTGDKVASEIREYQTVLGKRLYPLGVWEQQDTIHILIDEDGLVYTLDDRLEPFASSFDRGIEYLVQHFLHGAADGHDWKTALWPLVVVGLFITSIGLYYLYRAVSAGPLTDVAASALEEGKIPEGDYLCVRGTPRWDLGVRGEGSDSHRLIAPVVSQGWSTSRPAAAFIEILDRDGPPDRQRFHDSVVGFRVIGRGFAHGIQGRLERLGVRLTASPVLLNPNERPASIAREGGVFTAMSLVPLLLAATISRVRKKRASRRQSAIRAIRQEQQADLQAADLLGKIWTISPAG